MGDDVTGGLARQREGGDAAQQRGREQEGGGDWRQWIQRVRWQLISLERA